MADPTAMPSEPLIIGVSCFLRTGTKLVLEVRKPGVCEQGPGKPPLIYLGCIGGSLEAGESVIEALQREASEEIGCGLVLRSARATVDISPGGMTVVESGLIDDIGAVRDNFGLFTDPLGPDRKLLFSVKFSADAIGKVDFTTRQWEPLILCLPLVGLICLAVRSW